MADRVCGFLSKKEKFFHSEEEAIKEDLLEEIIESMKTYYSSSHWSINAHLATSLILERYELIKKT